MEIINSIFGYEPEGIGTLIERSFNLEWQNKVESVFSLGNGYLGLRSAHDEVYPGQVRDLLVAGTFQTACGTEISELPNLPDVTALRLKLDGSLMDLRHDKFTNYSRRLNLGNGELERTFIIRRNKQSYRLVFRRFVSFSQKHLIVTQVEVVPEKDGELTVIDTIDGTQSNHGAQHFSEGQKRSTSEGMSYQMSGLDGNLDVMIYKTTLMNTEPKSIRTTFPRRRINRERVIPLIAGKALKITNFVVVVTSRDRDTLYTDKESLRQRARKIALSARDQGYQTLLSQSTKTWSQRVWRGVPIKITSNNPFDQFILNFGRYHTHVMTPENDDRVNIAAKGLSGEGYRGHTFWDTEIFMLPYFQYEYPQIARNLLNYRVRQLPSSRLNAALNHYQGAQYPWESALVDEGETTPKWGDLDIDTGEPMRIWTGQIEAHITADVAYAMLAFNNTLPEDDGFYQQSVLPVLFDTARFWASRVTWDADRSRYEIVDVIGPNEYKEHVDNEAYTNYMAYYNMKEALHAIDDLQSNFEQYAYFNHHFGLSGLKSRLEKVLSAFYLPKVDDHDILPESDTFMSLKPLDLTPYREKSVGSISQTFGVETINEYQLCKQADVVLVMLLFASDFDEKTRKRNLDFYEARTMHDSSLSYGSHSILCARNREISKGYIFYHKAGLVDLGPDPTGSAEGIHAAAMVQLWNTIIQGFGGVSQEDRTLHIDPHLPEQWQQLEFPLKWQGAVLTVIVNHNTIRIKGTTPQPLELKVGNQKIRFTDDCTISLN